MFRYRHPITGAAHSAGDVPGNGRPDTLCKPWNTFEYTAIGGKPVVVYL